MNFSWAFIFDTTGYVVKALPLTLFLTIFPVTAGLVLGFLLALLKMYRVPVANRLVSIYVSFFRSIPLLVLLFLAFYGIDNFYSGFFGTKYYFNFTFYGGERVWGSIDMNKNVTAVVTLTLYSSAFLCEIVRGALNSVDMRQMEAAHALGMTKRQAYFRIIIPQAIIVALPNYFNFFLALLKGTSVVFTISVVDIMAAAKLQAEYGYRYIEAYTLVGFFYIILSIGFSQIFTRIEKNAKLHMGLAE